jgi:hypothetical protein
VLPEPCLDGADDAADGGRVVEAGDPDQDVGLADLVEPTDGGGTEGG